MGLLDIWQAAARGTVYAQPAASTFRSCPTSTVDGTLSRVELYHPFRICNVNAGIPYLFTANCASAHGRCSYRYSLLDAIAGQAVHAFMTEDSSRTRQLFPAAADEHGVSCSSSGRGTRRDA